MSIISGLIAFDRSTGSNGSSNKKTFHFGRSGVNPKQTESIHCNRFYKGSKEEVFFFFRVKSSKDAMFYWEFRSSKG